MMSLMLCVYCGLFFIVFFFKQKTASELRISDWSSDVCSSDLAKRVRGLSLDPARAWRRAVDADRTGRRVEGAQARAVIGEGGRPAQHALRLAVGNAAVLGIEAARRR